MRCTSCGTELIAGKPFCPACGASTAPRCRGCGASLEPQFRFCPDCGLAVGAAEVHDGPPPPTDDSFARLSRNIPEGLAHKVREAERVIEGERKQVTVLFCDLAGSTAIAEGLDPEEYHDLLDEYLGLAFREIYRFEGIVNQLAGDGMMALFGAPVAHEDAPQRAIRAALAIHEALDTLNTRLRSERGLDLQARIGINTGPVVAGTVGNDLKMDYTAIGDTTNAAARLEALADPGGILISEATHRLVRGFFDVESAGALEVKGKRVPVVAYRVLGRSAAATPMTIALERGLTPFVGRREELALLKDCYHRLGQSGAQVVAVVGEAGSGKSRLLYEFRRRLALEGTVFFEGRCSSMSQAAPYHPFLAMFRQYFDLVPGEAQAVSCDKVSAKVGVQYAHLEEMYPLLCRFLSLASGGPAELPTDELKQESFDALARLVLRESEEAPVVMVLEDLHWIDEPSRELLESLVVRLAGAPVLIVVSQRPDGQVRWRARGAFTQVVLRRLADDDVAAILRAIAGGCLPPELERRLVAKAEGSPFFAEEMTRSLLEEGYLVPGPAGCRLTRAVEEIPVPGTVQEVLAARLDRLEPQAKRVVQVAAVLGRQFSRAQLAAVLAGENIDVGHALADLEERGLVHRKTILSEDEYRFGESLTQEVAYEGLLLKQRRQLHERIGLLLEASPGEPSAERSALLAHHFARSDNRAKTVEALLRAAQDAERLPSYRTAVDFYRRAWEVADAGGGDERDAPFRRAALQATVSLCRLIALFGSSDLVEGERAARRAQALAEDLGDTEALAGVSYYHGVIIMMGEREQFGRGLALAEQGLTIAQQAGAQLPAIRISQGLAINYAFDGRFELARRAIGWVLDELERAGDRERVSDLYLGARWIRDSVLQLSDDLDAAVESASETNAMAVRAPNRTVRSGTAIALAQIHFMRGEYAEAQRWADEALEIADAIANMAALPGAAAVALAARLERGERVAPERYLDAIERGQAAGDSIQTNVRFVGDALLALGDLERVERQAHWLRRNRSGGRLREAYLATALGDLSARLDQHDEAQRAYAHAIALAETIGARSTMAAAVLGSAELAAARGEDPASAPALEGALAAFRALRLGRYLARAGRLLGADEIATAQRA